MKWFKHMADMTQDVRIKRVIRRYGVEGYGLYCYILELIVRKLDSDRPLPDLEESSNDIANDLSMDTLKVEEIMWYCIEQGLFEQDELTGRVCAHKVYKFLQQSETRNKEIRQMIALYKDKNDQNVCLRQSEAVSETNVKTRIEKNRLEKNRLEHIQEACVSETPTEKTDSNGRIEHPPELITDIIKKTKTMKSLPTERRLTVNIQNLPQIMDALSLYTIEEIYSALDNYEYIYQNKNEYRYFAYKDIGNFLINGGLQNFVDESNPLERYRTGGMYHENETEIQTDFGEVIF